MSSYTGPSIAITLDGRKHEKKAVERQGVMTELLQAIILDTRNTEDRIVLVPAVEVLLHTTPWFKGLYALKDNQRASEEYLLKAYLDCQTSDTDLAAMVKVPWKHFNLELGRLVFVLTKDHTGTQVQNARLHLAMTLDLVEHALEFESMWKHEWKLRKSALERQEECVLDWLDDRVAIATKAYLEDGNTNAALWELNEAL